MGTKVKDLYSKTLNTVPYFSGSSKESTVLTEQSVLYGSASTPTPNEDLLNGKTYKNLDKNF